MEKERAARKKEQHDAMLAGASGSGAPGNSKGWAPTTTVSYVPTQLLCLERAHTYKGAFAEPMIDAYRIVGMTPPHRPLCVINIYWLWGKRPLFGGGMVEKPSIALRKWRLSLLCWNFLWYQVGLNMQLPNSRKNEQLILNMSLSVTIFIWHSRY